MWRWDWRLGFARIDNNAPKQVEARSRSVGSRHVAPKPTAADLLRTSGAVLTSSHLKELGWTRTHIDAIWRACPMIVLPGTRRPVLRVEDYLAWLEEHTYRNEEPRVQPPFQSLAGPSPTERASRRGDASH
jgi:hypothetical protein